MMTIDEAKKIKCLDKVWINEYNIPGTVVGYHQQNNEYLFYVKFDDYKQGSLTEKFKLNEVEVYTK
jgi:hypothetical protein